jgi:hypothetical protein
MDEEFESEDSDIGQYEEPYKSELEPLALANELVSRLKSNFFQVLKSRLTKRNFNRSMDLFTKHIRPDLDATHFGIDWRASPNRCAHIIDICAANRNPCLSELEELVRIVYPYVTLTQSDELGLAFVLVSKTKSLASTRNAPPSALEEDNVDDNIKYLAYSLKHDINHMRRTMLSSHEQFDPITCSPLIPMTDPAWHSVAEQVYYRNPLYGMHGEYHRWSIQFRSSMWCNLHDHLLELCLTLASLRLTPYELLWILDLTPPMNFRCYREGVPYDPNHTLKLRLFESVAGSYRKIKMD